MKQALTSLQDMYKKGYLAKDFGTVDAGGKLAQDINGGKCGMFYGSYWLYGWPLQDGKTKNPAMEWTYVAPPTFDGSSYMTNAFQPAMVWFGVSKNCQNPEAIVKILNITTEKLFGATAEPTKYAGSAAGGAPVYLFRPTQNALEYKMISSALKSKDGASLPASMKAKFDAAQKFLTDPTFVVGWANYMIYNPENSIYKLFYEDRTGETVLDSAYWGTTTEIMTSKLPTYKKLALETLTKIVYGVADVGEWDKMVAEWNMLGGDEIDQFVNEKMSK